MSNRRLVGKNRAGLRNAAGMALVYGGLIWLSFAFIDRPFSLWSHAHLHTDVPFFDLLCALAQPVLPLASAVLAIAGIAALAGWRPGPRGWTIIAACLAAIVALTFKNELKFAFGRTWPETWIHGNPSWINNGVFGFFPFHGGIGWQSFPSGHTTAITAPMAVLWMRARQWRPLWLAAVVVVIVGLLGADYHFVSDVIAGTGLGIAGAAGVLALIPNPPQRGMVPRCDAGSPPA